MSERRLATAVGYHGGELAVQQRAGVAADAARLSRMVARGELRAGMAAFAADATFATITARDRTGQLWISPLLGPPGFLQATSPTTLRINTTLPDADPLHGLLDGQPVGIIIIDFATRRRVRINSVLTYAGTDSLVVNVDQVYGNCPQYIRRRNLHVADPHASHRTPVFKGKELRPTDIHLIHAADTFFLGTTHPDSGNDASHRGGPTGFVRATPERLQWPDYPGNDMFNSFGNLSVDPTAALLFVDFQTGAMLQLSGTATVCWDQPPSDDAPTGRRVEFTPAQVIATTPNALGQSDPAPIRAASHQPTIN